MGDAPFFSSACLRHKGNRFYLQASSLQLSPLMRSLRLQRACCMYSQALTVCSNSNEKALCCKNLGAAYLKQAGLELELCCHQQPGSQLCRLRSLLQSAAFFIVALAHGNLAKMHSDWMTDLEDRLLLVARNVFSAVETSSFTDEIYCFWLFGVVVDLCEMLRSGTKKNVGERACVVAHAAQLTCLIQMIRGLNSMTWASPDCVESMRRCSEFCAQAEDRLRAASSNVSINSEDVELLRQKSNHCQRLCDFHRAKEAGDIALRKALQSDFLRRAEHSHSAITNYKKAQDVARCLDFEAQAMIQSCIGHVYSDYLGRPHTAILCYREAINLVGERTLEGDTEWYIQSQAAVKQLEREIADITHREEASRIRRAKLHEELKDAIMELKREFVCSDTLSFLEFLYSNYPLAKDTNCSLQKHEDLRFLLRKCISDYHPDHCSPVDEKHRVLRDEITKLLLQKYKSLR